MMDDKASASSEEEDSASDEETSSVEPEDLEDDDESVSEDSDDDADLFIDSIYKSRSGVQWQELPKTLLWKRRARNVIKHKPGPKGKVKTMVSEFIIFSYKLKLTIVSRLNLFENILTVKSTRLLLIIQTGKEKRDKKETGKMLRKRSSMLSLESCW